METVGLTLAIKLKQTQAIVLETTTITAQEDLPYWNQNELWSARDYVTTAGGSTAPVQVYDGDITTFIQQRPNAANVFIGAAGIEVKSSIRVKGETERLNTAIKWTINNVQTSISVENQVYDPSTTWTDLTGEIGSFPFTVDSIEFKGGSSNDGCFFYAIEVDGELLVDNTVDSAGDPYGQGICLTLTDNTDINKFQLVMSFKEDRTPYPNSYFGAWRWNPVPTAPNTVTFTFAEPVTLMVDGKLWFKLAGNTECDTDWVINGSAGTVTFGNRNLRLLNGSEFGNNSQQPSGWAYYPYAGTVDSFSVTETLLTDIASLPLAFLLVMARILSL